MRSQFVLCIHMADAIYAHALKSSFALTPCVRQLLTLVKAEIRLTDLCRALRPCQSDAELGATAVAGVSHGVTSVSTGELAHER